MLITRRPMQVMRRFLARIAANDLNFLSKLSKRDLEQSEKFIFCLDFSSKVTPKLKLIEFLPPEANQGRREKNVNKK